LVAVLGINAYHADSAAALVVNGKLVAAAEEERFRRIKHWAGLPAEAARYCLREANLGLQDVDVVAVNSNPRAAFLEKLSYTIRHRPSPTYVLSRLRAKTKRRSVGDQLSTALGEAFRGSTLGIEHHLAHLSSAFHVSPFAHAVTVSVDGFGDFASAAWAVGSDAEIRVDGRVYFPHSLGIFYQALTQYLGFPHYGDEYKVMGLAPYGRATYLDKMRHIVRLKEDGLYELDLRYFCHHRERFQYAWDDGAPTVGPLYTAELEDLLGPARSSSDPLEQRHKDIAHSAQAMYEEAFFHLLRALHARYRLSDLALAGGCAANSVANGKIYQRTPFRRLYVQSAAGDAGGAIGAAIVGAGKETARFPMSHAYWGPGFRDDQVSTLLDSCRERIRAEGCSVSHVSDEMELANTAARVIASGDVLGWFQGRMEWGPRALGNRSILCDPRRADMKDILNLKIKRRESFRPFAPSILRETVHEWFETDDDVPFMMQVYQIRRDKRALIPAVTHVDGSGRLQTVTEEANPRYYRLIDAFRQLTGIPLVLNTSFNENEPVVCKPEEALECFLRTRMDALIIGGFVVRRSDAKPS
jgi:carbamoyltransferase